ncbi:MAG: glycosyltransferase family 2 protein [Imperialibacter sp.]|uniref:glycosyltransferase family 2 protein n=1 Tax=Imperialibacter sp. TaxID=2038411 RepID=UPI0032EFA522
MYKVSIVTVNLNNAPGLEKTIKSVVDQTYADIEYIVVDGASMDASLDVIRQHESGISRWISEPDSGVYNAMNKGIELSTGDYLLFLNSGDLLRTETVIEELIPYLGLNDIVYGDLLVVTSEEQYLKEYPDELKFSYFFHESLPHPATFIKRSTFNVVGLYNEKNKIVSDWEFFLLGLVKHGLSYAHVPKCVSTFQFDGLSSKPGNIGLQVSEREKILKKEFPLLIQDYELLSQIQKNYAGIKKSRVVKLLRAIGFLRSIRLDLF